MSDQCKEPHRTQACIWAAHTEVPCNPHNADDELQEADEVIYHQEMDHELVYPNEGKEYVLVDVHEYVQGNSHYERDTDTEFLAPMTDRVMKPEGMIKAINNDGQKNRAVKVQKVVMQASKTAQTRPVLGREEKECLATFVNVGGIDAWTLWDSGSTTTGVTPTFTQVANILVFPLNDPHILQLGTIRSQSTVNYGTEVNVTTCSSNGMIYMDVVNFDRYNMIIGTPYMRANRVLLDFKNNQVIVNGVAISATKVMVNDTDGQLHQYQATDKARE
jgi:hypothetical protein